MRVLCVCLCIHIPHHSTVWYELLCSEWPFRSQPCETVIWQVGRGLKQSLNTVNAPREVKVSSSSAFVQTFRSPIIYLLFGTQKSPKKYSMTWPP